MNHDEQRQSLYLLRHAKAEAWTPGCHDFGRELNERGHAHMANLSRWMHDALPEPDLILCSTSARTRETLAPILQIWPAAESRTRYLDDIYEATNGQLLALADAAFETADRLLMVGHNPGFEHLANALLRDQDAASIGKMATGTLAVIDFENGYAADCGAGVLRHWIRRKDL